MSVDALRERYLPALRGAAAARARRRRSSASSSRASTPPPSAPRPGVAALRPVRDRGAGARAGGRLDRHRLAGDARGRGPERARGGGAGTASARRWTRRAARAGRGDGHGERPRGPVRRERAADRRAAAARGAADPLGRARARRCARPAWARAAPSAAAAALLGAAGRCAARAGLLRRPGRGSVPGRSGRGRRGARGGRRRARPSEVSCVGRRGAQRGALGGAG